ncbi:MAG TPA: HAD-IIIC family phosphatase [bacterium]|nr:HAD-IIIC family phosphatase [bacterium]
MKTAAHDKKNFCFPSLLEKNDGKEGGRRPRDFLECYRRFRLLGDEAFSPPDPAERIALLSDFPMEPLAACLAVLARERMLEAAVYPGGHANLGGEILAPESPLHEFRPTVAIFTAGNAFLSVGPGADPDPDALAGCLLDVIDFFRERFPACRIVMTDLPPDSSQISPSPLNGVIRKWHGERRDIKLLDLPRMISEFGAKQAFDRRLESISGIPFSHDFLAHLAGECLESVLEVAGPRRKAVILDADNTLWDGIAGEETFDPGKSPLKETFMGIQNRARTWAERGILLALASRNNFEDTRVALAAGASGPLRLDDFAAVKVGWEEKPVMIAELAAELGLGLESFVFIDDDPRQRDLVRNALPRVLVPSLPADPRDRPAFLGALLCFPEKTTEEDLRRNERYRFRTRAEELKKKSKTLEEFLLDLRTEARVGPVVPEEIERAVQLFQRANQFNLTTIRYTREDLEKTFHDPRSLLLRLSLRDRFGELGLTGLALLRFSPEDGGAVVEALVLSCRVIGRGAEDYLLGEISRLCLDRGYSRLRGIFRPTSRNAPAARLYPRLGFALVSETESEIVYELELREPLAKPATIHDG